MPTNATMLERTLDHSVTGKRPLAKRIAKAYRVLVRDRWGETETALEKRARRADIEPPRDDGASKVRTLNGLEIGEEGMVVRLSGCKIARLKLSSLGVVPGATVVLEQRRPALVFRMGQSRFAVDEDLGSAIEVRPARPS